MANKAIVYQQPKYSALDSFCPIDTYFSCFGSIQNMRSAPLTHIRVDKIKSGKKINLPVAAETHSQKNHFSCLAVSSNPDPTVAANKVMFMPIFFSRLQQAKNEEERKWKMEDGASLL